MSSMEDMFNNTEANDGNNSTSKREMDRISDGTYNAEVTDFSVFSTDRGDYYVSWWFRVSGGAADGAELQSFSSVSPRSIGFIKKSVKRVTGAYPTWADMFDGDSGRTGPVRYKLVGKPIQVTQKTNNRNGKDYINVYVDKLLESAASVAPSQEDVDVDDLF